MSLVLLAAVVLIPSALWVWFFSRHDFRKEPLVMFLRVFSAGAAAVLPAIFLERPLRAALAVPGPSMTLLLALLAIGLIEEGAKLLAAHAATYGSPYFDEVGDGIVYAVTAALGFATVENLLYTAAFGLKVALVRSVITSLAHASFAGVFGLYLGLYRLGKTGVSSLFGGYLWSAGLHSLYDLLLVSRVLSPAWAIGLVYGVYRFVVSRLRRAALEEG